MEYKCEICDKTSKDRGFKYYHKKSKRHILIEKYGKEKGLEFYKKWYSEVKIKGNKKIKENRTPEEYQKFLDSHRSNTEDHFINKFGEEIGKIKWKERCEQNSETVKNRNLYDQEYRKNWKYNNSLKGFIDKYGQKKGEKKWNMVKEKKGKVVRREYFLEEAQANYDLADWLLSQRQATFSLKKCIKKHGEQKGSEIWKNRQEKWLNSYKKMNFSNISQELFWSVYNKIQNENLDIYFAQLDNNKQLNTSGKNYEHNIDIGKSFCKADFFIKDKKLIIEFDGDYWHGKARGNQKRDKDRDNLLLKNGYKVLHIKERDYNNDKENTIQKCLDFINE